MYQCKSAYLKRVEEVEKAPHNDDIVIDGNHEACDSRAQAKTTKEGMNLKTWGYFKRMLLKSKCL